MKISPCPFCGPTHHQLRVIRLNDVYRVYCVECDAFGPGAGFHDDAIYFWNTRDGIRREDREEAQRRAVG